MELQGSGYRLSLNKKRFATGMTDARSPGHAVVKNPSATQTPLLSPQGDTWQTAEVAQHSASPTQKKNLEGGEKESSLRGLPTTRLRLGTDS